jgi:hypothetical protein
LINVVECPEFRQLLLLLQQDLEDKDIPRQTKVREAIIDAWQAYFNVLKIELAVSLVNFVPMSLVINGCS